MNDMAAAESPKSTSSLPAYSAVLRMFSPPLKRRKAPVLPRRAWNAAGAAALTFVVISVLHPLIGMLASWTLLGAAGAWVYFRMRTGGEKNREKADVARRMAIASAVLAAADFILSRSPMAVGLIVGSAAGVWVGRVVHGEGDDFLRRRPSRPNGELIAAVPAATSLSSAIGRLSDLDTALTVGTPDAATSPAADRARAIVRTVQIVCEDATETILNGVDRAGRQTKLSALGVWLGDVAGNAVTDVPFIVAAGGHEAAVSFADSINDVKDAARVLVFGNASVTSYR